MTPASSALGSALGRFAGKVALVTGGNSGIGLATAVRLQAEGAQVVIAGRNAARGLAAEEALETKGAFVETDVGDRAQVDCLVEQVDASHGRLDVLVNCAGVVSVAPLEALSETQWRRCMNVNLDALFFLCQAALPLMRSTARTGATDAAIVNVASLDGIAGDRGMAAYGAAKAGVINFTRCIALELIRDGVRANCVSPGVIDTPMTVSTAGHADNAITFRNTIPAGRFGRPEEIAATIAFVASADASFMVGANLVVDGGMTCSTGHPDLLTMFGMDEASA